MLIRRLCSTESWPFGKGSAPPSKSVIERGRERLRPSGKRTTKKSGPREDRSATTGSVCPNKGWRAETTRTWDTNLSTTVAPWLIEDPTYADAILDRLVHNAHRIELNGESMRRARAKSPITS
jgi:hypothetical protein